MMGYPCALVGVVILLIVGCSAADEPAKSKKSEKLPPCQACRQIVNSFQKGVDKTKRGKYEGGDVDWEERKLGSYANSEVRLVEILELLCSDVDHGKDQCHSIVEESEDTIEKWWFHHQKTQPDFFTYYCIDTLKVCCPNNTFGPNCKPCPGDINKPCSGNGKCKGAGTRKGSGECRCDSGYEGGLCDRCTTGYYTAYKDEKKLICSECHRSCSGHCREAGPKGCEVCKEGWVNSPEYGCQDIDECVKIPPACGANDFCVNVEGSYQCIECHKSCDGCHGDGPDMCTKCKEGYTLKDQLCVDDESLQRSIHTRIARYVTYVGMAIATFIIFKKNANIAAVISVIVAIYIAASEYTVSDNDLDIIPKFT